MNPSLKNGDSIFLKREKTFQKNQIIIAQSPASWNLIRNGRRDILIKRGIGFSGDIVSFHNNSLFINNDKITIPEDGCHISENFTFTIPENKIFLAGDNVNASVDSRKILCSGDTSDFLIDKIEVLDKGQVIGKF